MRLTTMMADPGQLGLITDAGATVGEITVDGTMFLVFFGTVSGGLAGGALYAAARPWLPARRAGAVFALLALAAGGSHLIEADNPDFADLGSPITNVAMYVALFLCGGFATHRIYGRLERFRGSRTSAALGLLAFGVAVPALFGAVGVPSEGVGLGVPGAVALLIGGAVIALLTQVVVARAAAVPVDDVSAWMGPRLRRSGQIAVAVAIAAGLWALVREVTAILGVDSSGDATSAVFTDADAEAAAVVNAAPAAVIPQW